MTPATTALVAVAAWDLAVNGPLPDWTHIPVNLAAAASLVGFAVRSGASWSQLGLDRETTGAGLRLGAVAGGCCATAVAATLAVPAARTRLRDDRVLLASPARAWYEAIGRIPLGTAMPEELVFRGALPALLGGGAGGAARSTVAFGLWHIVPTLRSQETMHVATGSWPQRLALVAGTVVSTTLAGAAFAWLRRRSGSVWAPALAHAAINTTAYVGSRLAHRR
jgi:membrane protease YdiL (CAAX protease family)